MTLAELETFDRPAPTGKIEMRFLCPLCHGDRARTNEHRSLSANRTTGLWNCKRCNAKGLLDEYRTERLEGYKGPKKPRVPEGLILSAPSVAPAANGHTAPKQAPSTPPPPKSYDFEAELAKLKPLGSTPAAAYLAGRGIPDDVHGARYSPSFIGREAVVFDLVNEGGEIVGLSGRSISGEAWKRTIKASEDRGVFLTREARTAACVAIVEAPIDALTLELMGLPAIALNGTAFTPWLARLLENRTVVLAHDNDEAGQRAVHVAHEALAGASSVHRLTPPNPCKDWNEALQRFELEPLRKSLDQSMGTTIETARLKEQWQRNRGLFWPHLAKYRGSGTKGTMLAEHLIRYDGLISSDPAKARLYALEHGQEIAKLGLALENLNREIELDGQALHDALKRFY